MKSLFPAFVAWRYLRGKKTGNAVPVLSKVSMVAIGIGAAALITLFSVSNGFSDLIKNLYGVFYPELRITPAQGKFAQGDSDRWEQITELKGVAIATRVIEDNVLIEGNAQQLVGRVKGVLPDYFRLHDLAPYIINGAQELGYSETPATIMGIHVSSDLGLDVFNAFSRAHLFYPNGSDPSQYQSPEQSFNRLDLQPVGVFKVQEDFDASLLLAPYNKIASLFGKEGMWSSIEIKPDKLTEPEELQKKLQLIMGKKYKVETRFEQNRSLYNIMKGEKLAMYFILLLVLIIASFNMVGALLLLVVEKTADLKILRSMGMSSNRLALIFHWEGMMWTIVGGAIGLSFGLLLCLGQQYFGWIKMGDAFIIEAYPVAVRGADIVIVFLTILAVGFCASWYPARRAAKVT